MNIHWLFFLVLLVGCHRKATTPPPLHANGTLTPAGLEWAMTEADQNDGWLGEVQFTAEVAGVHISNAGQWYLHFGGDYPNQTLSVWWPKSYTKKQHRSWFCLLKGQQVTVKGRPRYYKGRPEVVVNEITDISIAAPPAALPPATESLQPTSRAQTPPAFNSAPWHVKEKGNPERQLEEFVKTHSMGFK